MTADLHYTQPEVARVLAGEDELELDEDLLTPPFPYFGGKRRVASVVWKAFGSVPNYVEPFAGSLAVLLGRPDGPGKIETVNDLDCYLANFWRATHADPEAVALHCDLPLNEAEVHARNAYLMGLLPVFRERMHSDPDHYNAMIAGWWVYGVCSSISGNWLASKGQRAKPEIMGWSSGRGIHKGSLPMLGHSGRGIHSPERAGLIEWFTALSNRLRRTRVACGDWSRVVTGSVTGQSNSALNMGMQPCAVFLDPPYAKDERSGGMYREDAEGVSDKVREWAIANGDDSKLRIALCGYEGEHEMPENWTVFQWKAQGGMANRSKRNENRLRERIWFSPHCLPLEEQTKQTSIFDVIGAAQ